MPPSKGKRQQPSPRAPSSRSSPDRGGGGGGSTSVDLPSIASAAAARFPALVPRGGAGCLAGTVDDVAPRAGSRGGGLGRLWLSEAAMVGAGMRPGCLVSVSSCFLTFLSLSPCSFDLGLFVSANCLCEPAWQIRYIQNQFKEVQFVAQIYVCVVTGRLDLSSRALKTISVL